LVAKPERSGSSALVAKPERSGSSAEGVTEGATGGATEGTTEGTTEGRGRVTEGTIEDASTIVNLFSRSLILEYIGAYDIILYYYNIIIMPILTT
jgi:hypothetical protein